MLVRPNLEFETEPVEVKTSGKLVIVLEEFVEYASNRLRKIETHKL